MKLVKIFGILFVGAMLLSGCAVQQFKPVDLPTKPEPPTLTKEEIKALEQEEAKKAQEVTQALKKEEKQRLAEQPKVSNVFVEADIRSILMDIATQAGVNIIPDATVQGPVSVELDQVPLETALQMVLFPGGYTFKRVKAGNSEYYLVGSGFPETLSFEPLSETRVVKTNIEADVVLDRLSDHFDPYLKASEGGTSITLSGPESVVNRLEKDIMLVDGSRRQIEISAVIAVIQWEERMNLGMNWGNINLNASFSGSASKSTDLAYGGDLVANLMNVVEMRDKRANVYIKAQPRLVVSDGEAADIKVTEEHLFLILSGGGSYYSYFTTKEVEVGLKIEVKPFVTRSGEISLRVSQEVSDIVGEREFSVGQDGGNSQKLPIIARRSETTNVSLENGETFGIGGLMMITKKETGQGVPVLGAIPGLNFIFGGKEKIQKEAEVVVFITPRIIK
ncbi:MAG: hypothetical protein GF387_00785 [Candidatus Portnoybacteria bacterium]|nr:hypothetical protein [Candidatus Portnoybacteria bacterium]